MPLGDVGHIHKSGQCLRSFLARKVGGGSHLRHCLCKANDMLGLDSQLAARRRKLVQLRRGLRYGAAPFYPNGGQVNNTLLDCLQLFRGSLHCLFHTRKAVLKINGKLGRRHAASRSQQRHPLERLCRRINRASDVLPVLPRLLKVQRLFLPLHVLHDCIHGLIPPGRTLDGVPCVGQGLFFAGERGLVVSNGCVNLFPLFLHRVKLGLCPLNRFEIILVRDTVL